MYKKLEQGIIETTVVNFTSIKLYKSIDFFTIIC